MRSGSKKGILLGYLLLAEESNMNRQTLLLAALLALSPSMARAQVDIHIEIGLPAAPRLVVVQPGIQVVEGFQEEVFFRDGWYWCRRPNGWYRARRPQARFEWVEVRRVPRALVQVPPGHYRNWHHKPKDVVRRGPHSMREGHRGAEDRRERGKDRRWNERHDRDHHRR